MNTELFNKVRSYRRSIHKYPELGNCEFKTSAFILKVLKANGISASKIAGTGVVGLIKGIKRSRISKTFAIRADIDALPIQEKTGTSFSSKVKGIMHACGHDANTAMVLGAAVLLAKSSDEFSGSVKLIFQPNEENSGGAKAMINAGILKNPAVDAIIGVHICPWLRSGQIGLKRGVMMASVDRFVIEVLGKKGHGAYPHLAKDAIVISAEIINSIQHIISRNIDPIEPAVISIGSVHGGERFNIICDHVKMVGTVRTLNETTREYIRKSILNKINKIASASGAKAILKYEKMGRPLINSDPMVDLCLAASKKLPEKVQVRFLQKPSMGGEDFAEYLERVPGCFIYIGSSSKGNFHWHHEKFDIDERVLPDASTLLAEIAKTYLK